MTSQTHRTVVEVPTVAGPMPAHLWLPQGGRGPGLLLLQEIFGVSDYVERRAADLAALGYVVLAPEIFHRLGQARVETGLTMLEEGMGLVQRLDWDGAVDDAVAALDRLAQRPEVEGTPGVVGFCFGGGLGFAVAAAAQPALLVAYYGSALPGLVGLADQVTCPQLHHFGTADAFIDRETQATIRAAVESPTSGTALAGTPHTEWHEHEGADHAFDNSDWPGYHPQASARAWEQTVRFLGEHLPTRPA